MGCQRARQNMSSFYADVWAEGNYAYAGFFSGSYFGGTHVVDLSDPTNPRLINVITRAHGGQPDALGFMNWRMTLSGWRASSSDN
jgi:hypothetical protein